MRTALPFSILAATLGLAACGTMGETDPNSYVAQERQLADDCRARGGILAPTGSQTGRPQNDNVCRITGQPSSRVSGN